MKFVYFIFSFKKMGPYLAQPVTDKAEMRGQSNKTRLRFSFAEMQGWRRNMEDAAIHEVDIGEGNAIFAVFDGHGGPEVSKYVQKIFIPILLKTKQYKDRQYKQALEETFRKVDLMIQSEQGEAELKIMRKKNDGNPMGENRVCDGSGCTANVAIITPNKIYVANAGDSRSVLSKNGRAVPLSFDHKPENQAEKDRITKAGGKIFNGRVNNGLNLSRSFGDFYYKQDKARSMKEQLIISHPDVKEYLRSPEDEFIVMGCDGIFERFVNDNQPLVTRIIEERKKGVDGVKIMKDLLDFLLAKDTVQEIGCDNMTCMLIQFI